MVDLTFLYQFFCSMRYEYGLKNFIETGSCEGDSIAFAQGCFESLYTIELHKGYYDRCVERFYGRPNIHLYHGDSVSVLRKLSEDDPSVFEKSLVFLDAHWSNGLHYEFNETMRECPLLYELDIVLPVMKDSFVLIHDARYFTGGVSDAAKLDPSSWPSFDEIDYLVSKYGYQAEVRAREDCIIVYPIGVSILVGQGQ